MGFGRRLESPHLTTKEEVGVVDIAVVAAAAVNVHTPMSAPTVTQSPVAVALLESILGGRRRRKRPERNGSSVHPSPFHLYYCLPGRLPDWSG